MLVLRSYYWKGTGGISALFLCRLRKTVDEAIAVYQEIAKAAFQPLNSVSHVLPRASSVHRIMKVGELEECVGNIMQHHLGDCDSPLCNPAGGSHT